MLLATSVQWFQAEHEALRAFWGLKLLLLSFFFIFMKHEGKHTLHLHFLADCSGDWPFQIGLPYVSVPHVYHFHKRSASQCSFRSNTRHYMRKKPTPLARSFPAPRPLSLSQLKEAGTYTVKCSLDSQDRLSKCVCEIPHPFEMQGDLLEHGPLRDSETFSLLFSSPLKPFISLPPLTRSRSLSLRLLFASLCWAITAQTEKWGSSAAVSVFLISFGKDDVFEWVRYPRSGAVERLILKYE